MREEWSHLAAMLPDGWESWAKSTGALRRARGIKDADSLLRVLLLHVAAGLSLRQAAARARVAGIADISDVALLKRLRASEPWLALITERMLSERKVSWRLPKLEGRRIRLVDATTVLEPGDTGSTWRVHYSLQAPSMTCDHFLVSDSKGGETFRNFAVQVGDVLVGDRAYSSTAAVRGLVDKGGDVVVRGRLRAMPLVDARGRDFDLLAHLSGIKTDGRPFEWSVRLRDDEGRLPGRLCAIRRSPTAAAVARERVRKSGIRQGVKVTKERLQAASFVFVFTTLPKEEFSTAQILEIYRMRWQIEMAFKRLKSLLQIGHVPKYDPLSARAWIQAKMITVLLTESLLNKARFFSPWGFALPEPQPMA